MPTLLREIEAKNKSVALCAPAHTSTDLCMPSQIISYDRAVVIGSPTSGGEAILAAMPQGRQHSIRGA